MTKEDITYERAIAAISSQLGKDGMVELPLPNDGLLKFDRPLPFLCIYRRLKNSQDDSAEKFVTAQAAYLVAPHDKHHTESLTTLCDTIGEVLYDRFGTFLFLEVWSADLSKSRQLTGDALKPCFRIVAPKEDAPLDAIEALDKSLSNIVIAHHKAEVVVERQNAPVPSGYSLLYTQVDAERCTCQHLGLEIKPVFWDAAANQTYPVILADLVNQVTHALRKTIFSHIDSHPKQKIVKHFDAIGPKKLDKTVSDVDRQLQEISDAFGFLLQVTPINSENAWKEFQKSSFDRNPVFFYRPLPFHPDLLKRKLYAIPLEHIEDPTLGHILREKRDELDLKISMLINRGTRNFLYGSLQLYGDVDDSLLQLAETILKKTANANITTDVDDKTIGAAEFSTYAAEDIEYYKSISSEFEAQILIRNDIASSVMVSNGNLLISEALSVPYERVYPLLQHEIGTHLVTFYNGKNQPFQQLKTGLADCEALQEGLAVFAEYLVGGLTRGRLRTIAARVVAVNAMLKESSFTQTFNILHEKYAFSAHAAFVITLRVYRGGGFTKDAVYLRGLRDLLVYLENDGEIEPLFVGKIALHHAPMVKELQHREILIPPTFWPKYLKNDQFKKRLNEIRGITLLDLCEEHKQ